MFACDEPLSENGQASATTYRATLPSYGTALAAPSRAARETALALGLDASAVAALRDLDVGSWAGRSLAEIAASEPTAAADFIADPTFAGHGGEAIADLVKRMEAWLADIAGWQGTTIAVVSPAVVRAAFVAAIRAQPSSFWHLDVAALTSLALTTDGRRWAVRELTPYLGSTPATSGR